MKKLLLITTIAFASMASAPASSKGTAMAEAKTDQNAQQARDVGPASNNATASEEKKICKLLPSTGTRFAKKACLTANEWKKVEDELDHDI